MNRTHALLVLAIGGITAALLLPRMNQPGTAPVPPPTPVPVAVTQPIPTTGAGPLTMTAKAARRAFLAAGDDVDVVVDVTARAGATGERVPVDLALVLDRSGSMTGRPIEKARAAARQLVQRLSENDRLALVVFSTDAQVRLTATTMDAAGKQDALRLISEIDADGGTNIGDALTKGAEALEAGGRREKAVRRIVLLSDGRANQGATGPSLVELSRGLGQGGVRVSALGLGADFDEDAMFALADASGGRYTYLENDDVIASALERQLSEASRTVAGAVRLELRAAEGVTLRDVVGRSLDLSGSVTSVGLSDIAEGDTRRVVVRVHANAARDGAVDLVRARLTYEDVSADRVARGLESVAVAEATHQADVVQRSWDAEAAKASLKARWGQVLVEASNDYVRDDQAGAESKLDAAMREIRDAARSFGDEAFAASTEALAGQTVSDMRTDRAAGRKYTKAKTLKEFGKDNMGF